MIDSSDDYTVEQRAVDARAFRAQATGTGNTLKASRMSGACRAQCVIDSTKPNSRAAIPPSAGYPPPTQPMVGMPGMMGMSDFQDSGY